jgi:hypothetical protein
MNWTLGFAQTIACNLAALYAVALLKAEPLGSTFFGGTKQRSINDSWVFSQQRNIPRGSINSAAMVQLGIVVYPKVLTTMVAMGRKQRRFHGLLFFWLWMGLSSKLISS